MTRPAPLAALDGTVFAILLLVTLLAWILVLNVGALIYAGVVLGGPAAGGESELLDVLFDPVVLGAATSVQLLGFTAIALGFARLRGRPLPLARPGLALFVALLAGAAVGPSASWLAEQLAGLGGLFSSDHLAALGEAIKNSGPLGRGLMLLAVCVLAPIGEELVFRGVLWDALAEKLPPLGVWLLTSVIFAGYHLDPLHVLSLAPTALMLGWMRYATGSVLPAIAAHFVNNALGVTWIFVLGPEAENIITAPMALASALGSTALCWGVWRLGTRPQAA